MATVIITLNAVNMHVVAGWFQVFLVFDVAFTSLLHLHAYKTVQQLVPEQIAVFMWVYSGWNVIKAVVLIAGVVSIQSAVFGGVASFFLCGFWTVYVI
ncbi:hypothetical protein HDU79_002119, partial [Rhizoclosmatium sp. JEL0117]